VRVGVTIRIRRPGIRAYRSVRLDADEVASVDGIPVTAPGRTLTDLAGVLAPRELERAVARAQRLQLITDDALLATLARHRGVPGIATLAAVLGQEGGAAFTRSELEDLFAEEGRRFGLSAPRRNVRVAGYELDCYWPEARLAVELDGAAWHGSWQSQVNDRRRDRELSAAGIQVIRVTWSELVHDRERTMVRIAQALAIARDRLARAGGV
jgi:very-short-patch-repair endonuclease